MLGDAELRLKHSATAVCELLYPKYSVFSENSGADPGIFGWGCPNFDSENTVEIYFSGKMQPALHQKKSTS